MSAANIGERGAPWFYVGAFSLGHVQEKDHCRVLLNHSQEIGAPRSDICVTLIHHGTESYSPIFWEYGGKASTRQSCLVLAN